MSYITPTVLTPRVTSPESVAFSKPQKPSPSPCKSVAPSVYDSSITEINSLTTISPIYSTVLLLIVQVEVLDALGNYQSFRILHDSASQASFITKKCVKRSNLPRLRFPIARFRSYDFNDFITCVLKPLGRSFPLIKVDAAKLPHFWSDMPSSQFSTNNWSHLANIELADS